MKDKIIVIHDDDGYTNLYQITMKSVKALINHLIQSKTLIEHDDDKESLKQVLDLNLSLEELVNIIPKHHRNPSYEILEVQESIDLSNFGNY